MKTIVTTSFILWFAIISFTIPVTAGTISGSGKIVKEVRNTSGFNAISNPTSADIIVEQGEETMVVVKTDQALIAHVITKVTDHVLTIEIDKSFRNIEVLQILVTTPDLKSVTINGSGDFTIDGIFSTHSLKLNINGSGDFTGNLNADKAQVDVRGSGDVDISGINDELSIHVTGSGDINARKLNVNKCGVEVVGSGDVDLEGTASLLVAKIVGSGDLDASSLKAMKVEALGIGSGDMEVFATNYLKAVSHGSGSIYYKGNPEKVMISEKGSGEIEKD